MNLRANNNESLVQAITSLAQDSQRKLFQAIPLYVCTAQDPKRCYPQTPIYCRSERLTLRSPGTRYLAAVLSAEGQQRQPIHSASTSTLMYIVDFAFSMFDWTDFQPTGLTQAEQQVFHDQRTRLRQRSASAGAAASTGNVPPPPPAADLPARPAPPSYPQRTRCVLTPSVSVPTAPPPSTPSLLSTSSHSPSLPSSVPPPPPITPPTLAQLQQSHNVRTSTPDPHIGSTTAYTAD